jgi:MFS family permease
MDRGDVFIASSSILLSRYLESEATSIDSNDYFIQGIYLMEKYGRKKSFLMSNVPAFLGWLAIVFSNGIPLLLVGRFLNGLAFGILESPAAVYIGEIR